MVQNPYRPIAKTKFEMRSWFPGKSMLWASCFVLSSLYLVALYFDFKIENISVFRIPTQIAQMPQRLATNNRTKTILFWNSMFGNRNFYFGDGDIFESCPVSHCYATASRDFANVEDFDAVIFHANELDKFDLPRRRSLKQYYVFANLESPENRPVKDSFFEDYFNLTMTYRLDSDIPWPYANIRDVETDEIVGPFLNTLWFDENSTESEFDDKFQDAVGARKTKAVAWYVSNCNAKSGRMEYVRELANHIDVDIYGWCGKKDNCKHDECFRDVVEPNYYFYLSFENTFCQDYVTEKLYNALRFNVVPIVYGAANYTKFAPPHSIINALDYESPEALAVYLKSLMENDSEYLKYFEWKWRYEIDSSHRWTACKLCEYLHNIKQKRTYIPMSGWYSMNVCPIQNVLKAGQYATKSLLSKIGI